MVFNPYHTLDELLQDINQAKPLSSHDPAQQNAALNGFLYKKHISPRQQTIIVKTFDSSSYNGPTTHDFIERLEILFKAINDIADSKYAPDLTKIKHEISNTIHSECSIQPIKDINDILAQEPNTIKTIKHAQSLLQTALCQAIRLMDAQAFHDDARLQRWLTKIAERESNITQKLGRPNYVNEYTIHGIKRFSINRVVGHAIPSTERTGNKLPNFVECAIGYKMGETFVPQFKGYRHSSYTPIKHISPQYGDSNYQLLLQKLSIRRNNKRLNAINTVKFERRKAAALCAKDMLTELARQQIAQGVDPQNPIPIKLSSLAMLSPIYGDKTFMRRGESEHRQLKESYNALMMYNNQTVTLNVDGKLVTVKPSITMMNAPSNWHGIRMSRYFPSKLEKNINAAGMNQYITKTETFLGHQFINNTKRMNQLSKELIQTQSKLNALYLQLEARLNETRNLSMDTKYQHLLQSIETVRHTMFNLESTLLKERMNQFKKKRQEINAYVNTIIEKGPKKTNQDEIAELFYQSLFMYLDKKVEPANFGARYLLVNEKMGDFVDFYCKSGEDRTGRMQNLIEELSEFYRKHGHFPRYDFNKKQLNKTDRHLQQDIGIMVSERSVSRDNTNANAHGARGLQLTSALELNTGFANRSGQLMGTLARQIYNIVAIKKLFRNWLRLFEKIPAEKKSNSVKTRYKNMVTKPSETSALIQNRKY